MFGVSLSVMGALLVLEYLYPVTNGGDRYFFTDFLTFTYSIAEIPPFVPVLLSSALFTRGIKEGATAGFITFLFAVILPVAIEANGANVFECKTGLCGSAIILDFLSPLWGGALGGAGGGAIGGWRAKRRAASKGSLR